MSDFVLEIGTEELPARFLAGLERELAERFGSALGEAGYEGWALHAFSTPRRAVVQIEGLAETQPEREELVSGPPVKAAFDAQGKPTRAAEGFARTLGLDVTALTRMQTAKGEYVAGVKKTGGGATLDALAALCPSVIAALPFAKRMRWGEGSFAYARPIRWILALFGDAVVSFEIGGVSSGRMTYGHRVMGAGPFEVPTAGDYLEIIRDKGKVEPQATRRRAVIREQGDVGASGACGVSHAAGGRYRSVVSGVTAGSAVDQHGIPSEKFWHRGCRRATDATLFDRAEPCSQRYYGSEKRMGTCAARPSGRRPLFLENGS